MGYESALKKKVNLTPTSQSYLEKDEQTLMHHSPWFEAAIGPAKRVIQVFL